jgi:hypothetical protein
MADKRFSLKALSNTETLAGMAEESNEGKIKQALEELNFAIEALIALNEELAARIDPIRLVNSDPRVSSENYEAPDLSHIENTVNDMRLQILKHTEFMKEVKGEIRL